MTSSGHDRNRVAVNELTPLEALSVLPQWDVGQPLGFPGERGGTANPAVVVDTTAGRFFLKRRNPRYSAPEMVRHDHELMAYLLSKGIPIPKPISTREGGQWVERSGAIYELYPYIYGNPHDPSSIEQVESAGRALALFHRAVDAFEPPPGKQWPRYHDPKLTIQALEWAVNELSPCVGHTPAGRPAKAARQEICELLAIAKRLATTFPNERYWACEQTTVHGDWHPANVKYEGCRVCGIFDLDWATRQPKMVDVADGIAFFASRRKIPINPADIRSLTQPFELDFFRIRVFLAGYCAESHVDPAELALLPQFLLARWLWCRADAMRRKVPREEAVDFLLDGIWEPVNQVQTMQHL